jgi:hypothetical protein
LHDYLPVKSIEAAKRSLVFGIFRLWRETAWYYLGNTKLNSIIGKIPPENFFPSFRLFLGLLLVISGLWQVIQQRRGRGDVFISGNLIEKVRSIRGKTDEPEL